ncbi:MAG: ABC transporter substrate-binding protein, partial [Flavobacteriaceae bacterium]|nr:ABC transporter substrate-binding protein [Flavobacteriaceae bacterium]
MSLLWTLSFFVHSVYGQQTDSTFTWTALKPFPVEKGLNGMYCGMHNEALILAGGTNFPDKPVWEGGRKKFYDDIYVLPEKNADWLSVPSRLPGEMANGVSINTAEGILCIGGETENEVLSSVFLLKWDPKSYNIKIEKLPPMPRTLTNMGGGIIGDMVYIIGGQQVKGGNSLSSFYSLNLKNQLNRRAYTWEKLPDFPGRHRIQPVVVGQSNGHEDCLYVISGLSYNADSENPYTMLGDVYQFNPHAGSWVKKQDVPDNKTPGIPYGYLAAAPAVKEGNAHILIFGGAGGQHQFLNDRMNIAGQLKSLDKISDSLAIKKLRMKDIDLVKSTSFSKTVWAYHTITDTWVKTAEMPVPSQIVTNAIANGGSILIPGGEIAPGKRTNKVIEADLLPHKVDFGWINYLTLIIYLLLMVFLGYYFSKRNKTTNDYFLGGGRIPWWAAGLSIYATMLSAITYLSQPALAYSFDWQAYLGYFSILIMVPIVITFYLPFFRKLNVTTAYEYLEKRFNITLRMFGSTS